MTAFNRFADILKRGVRIVTLMDGQTYSEESVKGNTFQLIGSIMIMAQANEESRKKSNRLKATTEVSTNRVPFAHFSNTAFLDGK